MDNKPTPSAQERFDTTYISTTDLMAMFKVSRPAVLAARRRGMLPNAISVNGCNIYIWEREQLTPYLDAWRLQLASRRGELA